MVWAAVIVAGASLSVASRTASALRARGVRRKRARVVRIAGRERARRSLPVFVRFCPNGARVGWGCFLAVRRFGKRERVRVATRPDRCQFRQRARASVGVMFTTQPPVPTSIGEPLPNGRRQPQSPAKPLNCAA